MKNLIKKNDTYHSTPIEMKFESKRYVKYFEEKYKN